LILFCCERGEEREREERGEKKERRSRNKINVWEMSGGRS